MEYEEIILEKATKLITEFDQLKKLAKHEDMSDLPTNRRYQLATRVSNIIRIYAPKGSVYAEENELMMGLRTTDIFNLNHLHLSLPQQISLLQAFIIDIKSGNLTSYRELIHGDLFSDYLVMAKYLLENQKLKDPAAVLIGATLETHIKLLSVKNGIKIVDSNNSTKGVGNLNNQLYKKQVYNKIYLNQVNSWYAIRNYAAHGEFKEFDDKEVSDMLIGVENFIKNFPA